MKICFARWVVWVGFSLVWMESEGRGLVWRGHLYWAVGSPVYVGYVVASGGLGFF